MSAADAVLPILTGLSTNTISKMFVAGTSGGRSFALRVIPGLIIVALAAWVGALYILISRLSRKYILAHVPEDQKGFNISS